MSKLANGNLWIHLLDDNLFEGEVASLVQSQQSMEEVAVSINIEHCRVVDSLLSQENTQRQQNHRTQPNALPHWPTAVACKLVAHVVYNVIDYEQ